jgi:small subunit ribosomal protein S4
LKGEKCNKQICPVNKRPTPPGQHGGNRRGKISQYGLQLREKQKAKRIYGLMEKQFHSYYETASRMKGVTGENLLRLLEMRLDNVMFRLGYGRSRTEARQIVRHNLVTVNGKKVNIPSYQMKVGDVVAVREKSRSLQRFKDVLDVTDARVVPEWLAAEHEHLRGTVVSTPTREQITVPVVETLIVEFYSAK